MFAEKEVHLFRVQLLVIVAQNRGDHLPLALFVHGYELFGQQGLWVLLLHQLCHFTLRSGCDYHLRREEKRT